MAATTLAPRLKAEAIGWLRDRLSSGPVPSGYLHADAAAAGHSKKTIQRAAIGLGIVKQPPRAGLGWTWALPEHATKPVATAGGERACSKCGVVQPIERFARHSRSKGGGPSHRCGDCDRARRRRAERIAADPTGPEAIERGLSVPDPAPAQRLREELARERSRGRPFEVAWPAALTVALEGLEPEPTERAEWRRAFRELRSAWLAGYDRSQVPGGDLPALLLMAA